MSFERPTFETKVETDKKNKDLEPLSDEELKELRKHKCPPEDAVERAKFFEEEGAKAMKEGVFPQFKRTEDLDARRKAEIDKYEWENSVIKLQEQLHNPEGYKKREEAMRAEWEKLNPKEKEERKARLHMLRFYKNPEVWEKKKEK